jgi:hypothetical protein
MKPHGTEMTRPHTLRAPLLALLAAALGACATAQTPSASSSSAPSPTAASAGAPGATAVPVPGAGATGPLAPLAWLEGCWRGSVNKREYLERWLPLRGGLLLGVSHTVMEGRTLDYEYLRLETRGDDTYYVTAPSGQKEVAYKLVDVATPDKDSDVVFTFANPAQAFPQKISYRKSREGWLYATVDGKVGGADRQVIYPMRRVSCETGEFITQ